MSRNIDAVDSEEHLKRSIISIQWVAFSTIVIKEVRRFMRIWQQTLLPPAITMILYFIIFGNLIGCARLDHDECDHQRVWQCFFFIFRQ
jgi:hypothetical protein